MTQLDAQLTSVSEKLSKDQEFRDRIVQDVVNAVKGQFDQNSKLQQEYEVPVAKVETHEASVAAMQSVPDMNGFKPDQFVAELEVQAMNLAAFKSEIDELR